MPATKEILNKIKHHDRLSLTVNENCKIDLPAHVLAKFRKPHKLEFYYFVFLDEGKERYKVDQQDILLSGGQLIFGLPNQMFCNPPTTHHNPNYKVGFDEDTLALLPNTFPFLLNPFNTNRIIFPSTDKDRLKSICANLFQLLHAKGKPSNTEIVLAHLNTLLTEFNSAYFEQNGPTSLSNPKLSKYIAFKLAVESNLTEQQDVKTIAEQLAMTSSSLYGVVKEFSGVSPKEWMINRLMLEARRRLQYSTVSVKELAYELGFSDPDYFSRLFKKTTGRSVSAFIAESRDLSSQ